MFFFLFFVFIFTNYCKNWFVMQGTASGFQCCKRWLQVTHTHTLWSVKQSCRTTRLGLAPMFRVTTHFPSLPSITGVIWAAPRAAAANFPRPLYTKLAASIQQSGKTRLQEMLITPSWLDLGLQAHTNTYHGDSCNARRRKLPSSRLISGNLLRQTPFKLGSNYVWYVMGRWKPDKHIQKINLRTGQTSDGATGTVARHLKMTRRCFPRNTHRWRRCN